jgi:hypothetical protein
LPETGYNRVTFFFPKKPFFLFHLARNITMANSKMAKAATVEEILAKYQAPDQPEDGLIDVWSCIPGAKIRAGRKRGLETSRKRCASMGWVDNDIIVTRKKMTVDGTTKMWYLVIDGMHRVTVARELAAAGNEARNMVSPPVTPTLCDTLLD